MGNTSFSLYSALFFSANYFSPRNLFVKLSIFSFRRVGLEKFNLKKTLNLQAWIILNLILWRQQIVLKKLHFANSKMQFFDKNLSTKNKADFLENRIFFIIFNFINWFLDIKKTSCQFWASSVTWFQGFNQNEIGKIKDGKV